MWPDWRNTKMDTEEKVNALFSEYPDCNLAFEPEDMGLAIIDGDTYHDGCNIAALDLPPTYEVQTPRGGTHFYFVGSLPPSVGDPTKPDKVLGPYIDTRGRGSYVLLPPSIVEGGRYEIKNSCPPAVLPFEIETRVTTRSGPAAATDKRIDLSGNIETARARLHNLVRAKRVSIDGQRGHDTCYEIACELVRDLGLSPELSLELMLEIWYPHCIPNNQPDFVRERVLSAARNGQNEVGAYATAPASEVFAGANLPALSEPAQSTVTKAPWFMGTKEQLALPDPTWLVPDVIPERRIVLMSALKGHFKTFLSLDLALGVCTGQETFGVKPTSSGLVFYGAHESMEEIAKMHRPAWFSVHGLEQNAEPGFFLGAGPHMAIEAELTEFGAGIEERAKIEGRPVKLIVIDTYSASMMGLDENNPSDANRLIFFCRSLINVFGCSVLIQAHLGKDTARGTRGTSALEYGVDTVLDVVREEGTNHVKLRVRRHRGAPERKAPYRFEGRPVGQSLVFNLLSHEEASAFDQVNNEFDRRKIVSALRDLGAVNDELAIVTRALAMKITIQEELESPERHEARVTTADRTLRRLARSTLHELTFGEGKHLRWCLPSGVVADPDGLD
jgi:AAA domain/Bifunctional DNA primase/polymerase, N-terminal